MKYDWIDIYQEFANRLLHYKNNRIELIRMLQEIYKELNLNYPLKDGEEAGKDVCPFSVMGIFNRQISDKNRINILSKIKNKFNLNSNVPTDFSGIPLLSNMMSMFYHFTPYRKDSDIPNLWNLFEMALQYADNQNESNYYEFCKSYNTVIEQPLVKWNITMGLYWIRPYTYLNLDAKNREYLSKTEDEFKVIRSISNLKNVPTAEEYLKIIDECKRIFNTETSKFKNFVEFSDNAFLTNKKSNASFLRWFKPLLEALKELGGTATPGEVRRKIIEDEKLSEEDTNEVRGKTEVNKFTNELAFARSYLVLEGLIDGSERGVWKITEIGKNIEMTDEEATRIFSKWVAKLKEKRDCNSRSMDNLLVGTDLDLTGVQTQRFVENEIWQNEYDYTKEDFLKEVFMDSEQYDIVKNTLIRKKNIILQGVPGVGKTFCAKKLFFSIIGKKDDTKIKTVQFHQSYSYEDFIQGFRPNKDGKFELKDGIFYNIVKEAREEWENAEKENRRALEYCIIIDEINRGNLSKVFGELMMLIEGDKREKEWAVKLTYSPDEDFYIPKNLYIIGTMNTADRSLTMIDYALRRRFSFITLKPAFENKKLENYLINNEGIEDEFATKLTQMYIGLNRFIKDTFKNNNFVIGHSYFINQLDIGKLEQSYNEIVEYDIKPLLEEYFFGEEEKIDEALNKIRL